MLQEGVDEWDRNEEKQSYEIDCSSNHTQTFWSRKREIHVGTCKAKGGGTYTLSVEVLFRSLPNIPARVNISFMPTMSREHNMKAPKLAARLAKRTNIMQEKNSI